MISDSIKEIRRKSQLSQADFGKKIGVTQGAVSQWENNITRPNSEQLQTISKVFGVTIDSIIGNESVTQERTESPNISIVARGMEGMSDEEQERFLAMARAAFPAVFGDK